jgi:hypothetical protein
MFHFALVKKTKGLLMTSAAIVSWCFWNIGYERRHVDRMARQASLEVHVFCVLLVAIHAVWNKTMSGVTLIAR